LTKVLTDLCKGKSEIVVVCISASEYFALMHSSSITTKRRAISEYNGRLLPNEVNTEDGPPVFVAMAINVLA
jgi:hypothetical protein